MNINVSTLLKFSFKDERYEFRTLFIMTNDLYAKCFFHNSATLSKTIYTVYKLIFIKSFTDAEINGIEELCPF